MAANGAAPPQLAPARGMMCSISANTNGEITVVDA
jgi:hypothetical protein